MYKHDTESYIITIRRKVGVQSATAPLAETETLKPAQPVCKIEKPAASPGVTATGGKTVKSPLPGVMIAVKVNVGDEVKAGDVVAVLEAMKMENEIQSEYDGTVTAVNVAPGDSVLEGALIVSLS